MSSLLHKFVVESSYSKCTDCAELVNRSFRMKLLKISKFHFLPKIIYPDGVRCVKLVVNVDMKRPALAK